MNRQPPYGIPLNPAWDTHVGVRSMPSSASSPAGAMPGDGFLPNDADAIVRLLAQLLRGVLDATSRAAGSGVGVSA